MNKNENGAIHRTKSVDNVIEYKNGYANGISKAANKESRPKGKDL